MIPSGLKPVFIVEALRGAEAPLFHGTARDRTGTGCEEVASGAEARIHGLPFSGTSGTRALSDTFRMEFVALRTGSGGTCAVPKSGTSQVPGRP